MKIAGIHLLQQEVGCSHPSRMAETTAAEDRKFYLLGKELAHTEKSVRDKAVEKIRRYFLNQIIVSYVLVRLHPLRTLRSWR